MNIYRATITQSALPSLPTIIEQPREYLGKDFINNCLDHAFLDANNGCKRVHILITCNGIDILELRLTVERPSVKGFPSWYNVSMRRPFIDREPVIVRRGII